MSRLPSRSASPVGFDSDAASVIFGPTAATASPESAAACSVTASIVPVRMLAVPPAPSASSPFAGTDTDEPPVWSPFIRV